MRANYESREAGDRSDTRPAARRDSSGNPNLYSRKQALPRQARSPTPQSLRRGQVLYRG